MSTVAIGFFDGVHLGHQKILQGADKAITFRNHPLSVLNAAKAPPLIMSFEDRVAAIKACGVKEVVALDFDEKLANLSPEEFLRTYIGPTHWRGGEGATTPKGVEDAECGRPRPHGNLVVKCGANWRFGKSGEGSPEWLRGRGVAVEVVPAAEYEGAPISSTRIREALARGEIAAANAMMGRRFAITGEVVKGKGEGAKLGYPTVNIRLSRTRLASSVGGSQESQQLLTTHYPLSTTNYQLPTINCQLPCGVYVVEVGGERAIANYGFAPTFGERAWSEPTLEIHFLECSRVARNTMECSRGARGTEGACAKNCTPSDSRGCKKLRVEFSSFLRPERKFGSVEELKAQIAADIANLV